MFLCQVTATLLLLGSSLQLSGAQTRKNPSPSPVEGGSGLLPIEFYEKYFASKGGGGSATCFTYSMSEYAQNYETEGIMGEFDMWALHALQWKAYVHALTTGGSWDEDSVGSNLLQDYQFSGITQCSVPTELLNGLEDESSQVYLDENGVFVDPNGIWICREEEDAFVAAVLAAMNMHYWATPTYFDMRDPYENFDYWIWKGVIEQVTLCAEGDLPPHEVCGWGDDWTDTYDTIETCSSLLALDSARVGIFTFPNGNNFPNFIPHVLIPGSDWYGHYGPNPNNLSNGIRVVFDPPQETTEKVLAKLQKMAKATSENLLVIPKSSAEKDDLFSRNRDNGGK